MVFRIQQDSRRGEMMSSVGLSGPGIPIGGIGGRAAASARRSYHCYQCNRTVAILANDELICPFCYGAFLEEVDRTNLSPSSPLTTAVGSVSLYDDFSSFSSASDSDGDVEFSCLLPPPPPPPPLFTAATDAAYNNSHNDTAESSDHLPPLLGPPPPPPPPPSNLPTTGIISGRTIDFSERFGDYFSNLPPPPPPPPSNLPTTGMISGLTIDFSETVDDYFPNPPPPPPPPATDSNESSWRSHRLPSPPWEPPSRSRALHFLPLPPPPPPPAFTTFSFAPSSSREIQSPHALPPRPPPPLTAASSSNWEYFLPSIDPRDHGSDVERQQEEDPDDDLGLPDWFEFADERMAALMEEKFIYDRKMTRELMNSEESSQCAVCLENLELDEIVKKMPCKHIFHSHCILTWLDSRPTCPVCRYKLSWNCVADC